MFNTVIGIVVLAAPIVACALVLKCSGVPLQFSDTTSTGSGCAFGSELYLDNMGVPVTESFKHAYPVNRDICDLSED